MFIDQFTEQEKHKFGVRYVSRGGNTKQIAEAMAEVLGCEAQDSSARIRGYYDTMFVGGGLYKGKLDENMESLLTRLTRRNVGKIILFGDASHGDPCKKMRKKLLEREMLAETEVFMFKGGFKLIGKSSLSEADLQAAREFAEKWMQEPK